MKSISRIKRVTQAMNKHRTVYRQYLLVYMGLYAWLAGMRLASSIVACAFLKGDSFCDFVDVSWQGHMLRLSILLYTCLYSIAVTGLGVGIDWSVAEALRGRNAFFCSGIQRAWTRFGMVCKIAFFALLIQSLPNGFMSSWGLGNIMLFLITGLILLPTYLLPLAAAVEHPTTLWKLLKQVYRVFVKRAWGFTAIISAALMFFTGILYGSLAIWMALSSVFMAALVLIPFWAVGALASLWLTTYITELYLEYRE